MDKSPPNCGKSQRVCRSAVAQLNATHQVATRGASRHWLPTSLGIAPRRPTARNLGRKRKPWPASSESRPNPSRHPTPWDARSHRGFRVPSEERMPDPTLRFAAGSPERPNSGVWRLWSHGSDAYLAARITAHLFKLSMHKSGDWISAFTSQSGVIVDKETRSRRHRTWSRPPEFTRAGCKAQRSGSPGSSGAASSNPSGSRHHPTRCGFLARRGSGS